MARISLPTSTTWQKALAETHASCCTESNKSFYITFNCFVIKTQCIFYSIMRSWGVCLKGFYGKLLRDLRVKWLGKHRFDVILTCIEGENHLKSIYFMSIPRDEFASVFNIHTYVLLYIYTLYITSRLEIAALHFSIYAYVHLNT